MSLTIKPDATLSRSELAAIRREYDTLNSRQWGETPSTDRWGDTIPVSDSHGRKCYAVRVYDITRKGNYRAHWVLVPIAV